MTGPITLRLSLRERRTFLAAVSCATLEEEEFIACHTTRLIGRTREGVPATFRSRVEKSRRLIAAMSRLAARVRGER